MKPQEIKIGKLYKHSYTIYLNLYDRSDYFGPDANLVAKLQPEIPFFILEYYPTSLSGTALGHKVKILTEQGIVGYISLDNVFINNYIWTSQP